MLIAIRPYFFLLVLWLLYFHPLVLHPTQVLYSDFSDLLAEHLPARVYIAHEWQQSGELPLWNPYHFCGAPFVHDIQVGMFYPPYAATLFVPESHVGMALSWVVALHVLLAGAFTFVYARSNGLGEAGSFVAAVGFMFSAKWMTHLLLAGHTITVGLAWLPLVVLGLERGIRTGRKWPAVWAGVAFALVLLGTHPQWAFYGGVFAAAWTFGSTERTRAGVRRWLLCGLAAAAVALLLTAVQLLPTLEASRYSARSVGLEATQALQVGVYTLFGLVGPSATYDPPATWETRALFGLFWLAAAVAAPMLAGGKVKWWFGVFLGMVLFSLGGAVLIEWLPGFNLFRVPSRMLLVAAFPLAVLAGVTTDALIRARWVPEKRAKLRRGLFVALPALALSLVMALAVFQVGKQNRVWISASAYWSLMIVLVPTVMMLAWPGRRSPDAPAARTRVWIAALLLELLVPTAIFPALGPATKPQLDIYPNSGLVSFLRSRAAPGEQRVIDVDNGSGSHDRYAPLGGGSPMPLVAEFETARGYNPLDVRHYREFIGFVVNDDDPVLSLSPVAQPILPNFPRTNRALFDLLNVRYLACFPEYLTNEDLQTDPAHHLKPPSWVKVKEEPRTPAVPALPPDRPNPLPPTLVFENVQAMPRAFVVPAAAPIPIGQELAALKANDFRRTVLLSTSDPLPPNGTQQGRAVVVTEYRPNRVALQLDGRSEGCFLVLSDVWFPGWVCRVDGVEVPVLRANHAFRGVALPAGARQAVFTFAPRSYVIGWWVSAIALCALVLTVLSQPVIRAPYKAKRPAIPKNP